MSKSCRDELTLAQKQQILVNLGIDAYEMLIYQELNFILYDELSLEHTTITPEKHNYLMCDIIDRYFRYNESIRESCEAVLYKSENIKTLMEKQNG